MQIVCAKHSVFPLFGHCETTVGVVDDKMAHRLRHLLAAGRLSYLHLWIGWTVSPSLVAVGQKLLAQAGHWPVL